MNSQQRVIGFINHVVVKPRYHTVEVVSEYTVIDDQLKRKAEIWAPQRPWLVHIVEAVSVSAAVGLDGNRRVLSHLVFAAFVEPDFAVDVAY